MYSKYTRKHNNVLSKPKRHSNYLKLLEEEISIAAEKAGIDLELGKDLIDEFFQRFKTLIQDPRVPTVSLPKIGYFRASYYQISRRILYRLYYYKLGSYPRYLVSQVISKYWKVYKRMVEQKFNKGVDKTVSVKWNNIDPGQFKIDNFEGLCTKLPEKYLTLSLDEWTEWIFSEARYTISAAPIEKAAALYNSAIRRLNEESGAIHKKIDFKVGGQGRPAVWKKDLIQKALKFVEKYEIRKKVYKSKEQD